MKKNVTINSTGSTIYVRHFYIYTIFKYGFKSVSFEAWEFPMPHWRMEHWAEGKGHGGCKKWREKGKTERHGPLPGAMAWKDECGSGMAIPWDLEGILE
jgi:hypothetical protein